MLLIAIGILGSYCQLIFFSSIIGGLENNECVVSIAVWFKYGLLFFCVPTKNGTLAFSAVFVRTFLSIKLVFQIGLGNYEEHSYNFSLDWQLRAFPDKNKATQCQMVDFSRIKTLKGMQKVLWLIYWHSQNPLKLRQPARHHLMRMQNVWLKSPWAEGGGELMSAPFINF